MYTNGYVHHEITVISGGQRSLSDGDLMVHIPICVHREEHWPGRCHSSHLRANRIFHCGRGGQGRVWRAHLGHCSREVEHLRHHCCEVRSLGCVQGTVFNF